MDRAGPATQIADEVREVDPLPDAPRGGVSVVIPVHNEAGAIAGVVRDASAHTPSLVEVLVVDDGSTDGSADAARTAGARVVRLERNGGKGRALRRGIEEAAGEILVFLDGDGQDDPAEIPALVVALEPHVDMVIGSRFLGRFEDGSITPLNRFGTRMLTAVFNGLYRSRISDPIAGFRVVRKAALADCALDADRYDIEVEVLAALLQRRRTVIEIPVARYRRPHGKTDLSSIRDGWRILRRILARRVGLGWTS